MKKSLITIALTAALGIAAGQSFAAGCLATTPEQVIAAADNKGVDAGADRRGKKNDALPETSGAPLVAGEPQPNDRRGKKNDALPETGGAPLVAGEPQPNDRRGKKNDALPETGGTPLIAGEPQPNDRRGKKNDALPETSGAPLLADDHGVHGKGHA